MKTDYPKYIISLFVLILITWTLSCSGRSGKNIEADSKPVSVANGEVAIKLIKIISPEENTGFKLNDPVKVILAIENSKKLPDSVIISFNGKVVTTLKSEPWEYSVPPVFTVTTGRKSLKVTAYKGGKPHTTITRFMIIYSDIIPKRNGYKVVNSYPHDSQAFTEGLVYDNGLLFESTGQETSSSLREVELETGKIIRQLNLDASLFGEGIALYQDRIYQVTYTSKVGFIYEKSTFNIINKIYYPTQGWGITTIDNNIIMSDGTNVLYFFEPEMFTVVSRIEVYDNEMKIDSLNELEYINGEIWANIWMTDLIVRIDPVSGKVIAYIDLKGLLSNSERKADTDVLNGIAYDPVGKRIFVTGKNWPNLFEIRITE
ncbi:MAG TPA: glutaminyl-peptide cyclotransferase [Bacteroidales bacterium]|nr:glutaminyl-peptide cyclotransferase [Bacteroidales bacterium]